MIQQIRPVQSAWYLHVVESLTPTRIPPDLASLPTFLVVADQKNQLLAKSEPLLEPEQTYAEDLLQSLLEQRHPPSTLYIQLIEEWNQPDWLQFADEFQIHLHFLPNAKMPELPEEFEIYFYNYLEKNKLDKNFVAEIFDSLPWIKSPRIREQSLRQILDLQPNFSPALVELADLLSSKSQWKEARQLYSTAKKIESPRWANQKPLWWENPTTRPYLRSLFGEALTLWHLGKIQPAAETLAHLLQLNPKDHQGARFYLPMALLSLDDWNEAENFFDFYEKNYPYDFIDPALYFGWALTLHHANQESAATAKYRKAILKNIYIAPLLLEEKPPTDQLWFPNDRAEPSYAYEFVDSYAVLWEKESSYLRLLREVWHHAQPRIALIIEHRRKMLDFQDQRYDPSYRQTWESLVAEDEKLTEETDSK